MPGLKHKFFTRNPQKPERPVDNLSPGRVFLKSYLLVDDMINLGVNRAAEKIENRFGCSRRMTIIGFCILGAAASPLLSLFVKANVNERIAACIFPLSIAANTPKNPKKSEDVTSPSGECALDRNSSYNSITNKLFRSMSMIVALTAIPTMIIYESGSSLLIGMAHAVVCVALHLQSNDNGTLKRIKEYVVDLVDKIRAVTSQKQGVNSASSISQ